MKSKEFLISMAGLIIGCILLSIGFNMFLAPNTIAPGGLSGFAIVINEITGVEPSIVLLVIGVPLALFAYKVLGRINFIKTFIGTVLFSIMLDITSGLSNIKASDDVLLVAIFGAICVGLGLGIVLKADMSTGGTDLIAVILNKKFPRIKISRFITILDAIVVISSGIVTKNLETALYSAISLYIIIKVIDAVMDNFDYSKSFVIISEKPLELKEAITKDLDRGLTVLNGRGGFTDSEKDVLLVAIPKNQENSLKKLVQSIDSNAFMMINDVHEIHGKGFTVSRY